MVYVQLAVVLILHIVMFNPLIYGTKYVALTDEKSCAEDDTLIQWMGGQFEFPCSSAISLYKNSGRYKSKNIIATRAQIINDTIYMALPRFREGVPATLVKTILRQGSCELTFTPFPCWDLQQEGNCKALQSVVDVVVDRNEIIWVLDTGICNTLENPVRKCPPKVVAFSAQNGRVLKNIDLGALSAPNTRLQYLIVDYADNGHCFVYVSDAANHAILVFNIQENRGFRVLLPKAITAGTHALDVLYLALVRHNSSVLYFTYLSSHHMFSLRAEYLRSGIAEGRILEVGKKPNRMVIIGTDNGAALFLRNEGDANIYRWNTTTTFIENNFQPVYRSTSCQLATHAMADHKHHLMRVLQSNFPDFIQNRTGCGALQQLAIIQGC